MAEASFYHLQSTPLEKALPKLLDKIYSLKLRTIVLVDSEERLSELNMVLWTFSSGTFLPHGSAKEGFPEDQPIWLTTRLENPNDASVIVITNGMTLDNLDGFERIIDIFSGRDEDQVSEARKRWKNYSSKGIPLTYWKQTQEGSWEKQ